MLVKYREELTRPLQEAMEFMQKIEAQLNMLGNAPDRIFNSGTNYAFSSYFSLILLLLFQLIHPMVVVDYFT